MLRVVLFLFASALLAQSKMVRKHTETGVIDYDDEPTVQENDIARRLAGASGMTAADRAGLLAKHNSLRSTVANGNTPGQPGASKMLKLIWDPALEAVATAYSQKCVWNHNPNRASEYNSQPGKLMTVSWVGENLYMSSSTSGSLSLLESGIQGWYDEYKDYNYNTQGCSGVCGHYTQVVWADTLYVGCGYGICNNGVASSSFQTATILTCNYLPGGNFNGQKPYPTGSVCSSCPTAQNSCQSGLCVAGGGGSTPTTTTTTTTRQPTTRQPTGNNGPAPTNRPTPPPVRPTPPPVNPTRRPTPPPVTSGGGGDSGDGSCNSGLTGTMGFYFPNSDATCTQYKQALVRFQPCVGQVLSCTDVQYPGFSSYRRVTLKWQLNSAKWALGFNVWRKGIQTQLGAMGVQFSGAATQGTPPADTGALETSTPSNQPQPNPTPMIIGVLFGVVAFILVAVGVGCYWYNRQQKRQDTAEFRMMQEQRTGQYHPPSAPIIS